MDSKSVDSIILDTSPILNNIPTISSLLAKSRKIYTVPAIIDEIKDADARSKFEITVLPFLTIRTPKPDSIEFVTDFSRKTGDYSVLSKPDIQILALAYELECENNGGDWRLRKNPGQKGLNGPPPQKTKSDSAGLNEPRQNSDTSSFDPSIDEVSHDHVDRIPDEVSKPGAELGVDTISADVEALRITDDSPKHEQEPLSSAPESVDDTRPLGSEEDPDLSDVGSDGWITPSNLKKQQAKDSNVSIASTSESQVMVVATITEDFAMQNVILQIGLNLLSPSFQRIRIVKTYILRCHACFEKVKGKPTLTRVSCSTNQKGEFKIYLKKNMQWNHRGDRYSIPKPVPGSANGKVGQGKGGGKGGWGQELVLAEDQKEYLRAMSGRKGKRETDLMDADYLPGILTGERGRIGGRPKVGAGRNVNSKKR